MSSYRIRAVLPVWMALTALLLSGAAASEISPRCEAAINHAAGRYSGCLLRADAHFARSQNATRWERQQTRCETRFERHTTRAQHRHGASACASSAVLATIQLQTEGYAATVADEVGGTAATELFFSHTAEGAVLSDSELTLQGVGTETHYDWARPGHPHGMIDTEKVLGLWETGGAFATDPPIGTLSCDLNGEPVSQGVQLTSATLSGDDLQFEASPHPASDGSDPFVPIMCDGETRLSVDQHSFAGAVEGSGLIAYLDATAVGNLGILANEGAAGAYTCFSFYPSPLNWKGQCGGLKTNLYDKGYRTIVWGFPTFKTDTISVDGGSEDRLALLGVLKWFITNKSQVPGLKHWITFGGSAGLFQPPSDLTGTQVAQKVLDFLSSTQTEATTGAQTAYSFFPVDLSNLDFEGVDFDLEAGTPSHVDGDFMVEMLTELQKQVKTSGAPQLNVAGPTGSTAQPVILVSTGTTSDLYAKPAEQGLWDNLNVQMYNTVGYTCGHTKNNQGLNLTPDGEPVLDCFATGTQCVSELQTGFISAAFKYLTNKYPKVKNMTMTLPADHNSASHSIWTDCSGAQNSTPYATIMKDVVAEINEIKTHPRFGGIGLWDITHDALDTTGRTAYEFVDTVAPVIQPPKN